MRSFLVFSCVTSTLILAACGQDVGRRAPAPEQPTGPLAAGYQAFAATPSDAEMMTLLKTYCIGCHSTAHPARAVVLDTIAGATAAATKAHTQLKNASMPPRQAKQPSAVESKAMDTWFLAHM